MLVEEQAVCGKGRSRQHFRLPEIVEKRREFKYIHIATLEIIVFIIRSCKFLSIILKPDIR